MKKLMVYFVIFALMAVSVLAGSVGRNMLSRAQPGQTLTVTLSISGATADKSFTLEDVIPAGLKIKEWTVTGAKESKEAISIREKGSNFGWSFTPTSGSASVEYIIDLPNNEATYTFGKIVWFDPSGQGTEASSPALTVATIRCGDSVCEGSENSDNCEQDCPKPAPAQQPAPAEEQVMEKKGLSNTALALIVVAIIVIAAAVGYYMMQKKKAE